MMSFSYTQTMVKLFFFLMLTTLAYAAPVKDHFCSPRPDSKRYLSNDFGDYPRSVLFECTYECRVGGRTELVVATSKVRVTNLKEDAILTACQGVKVKEVPWGYDFDRIEPFYAFDSSMKEMKAFAFGNLSFSNPTEKEYLKRLKSELESVIRNYRLVPHQEFKKAATRLEEIASELPMKTKNLEEEIKKIIRKKGDTPLDGTAQSYVSANIKSLASWRLPTHLF
jgi:hypothetical protein